MVDEADEYVFILKVDNREERYTGCQTYRTGNDIVEDTNVFEPLLVHQKVKSWMFVSIELLQLADNAEGRRGCLVWTGFGSGLEAAGGRGKRRLRKSLKDKVKNCKMRQEDEFDQERVSACYMIDLGRQEAGGDETGVAQEHILPTHQLMYFDQALCAQLLEHEAV